MLNKLNDHEREPISDIINGATKGNSQMGYWHNTSYWTLRTEGWEGVTEIGTLSEREARVKFLESYVPKSFALWKKAVKDGADAVGQ